MRSETCCQEIGNPEVWSSDFQPEIISFFWSFSYQRVLTLPCWWAFPFYLFWCVPPRMDSRYPCCTIQILNTKRSESMQVLKNILIQKFPFFSIFRIVISQMSLFYNTLALLTCSKPYITTDSNIK